MQTSKKYDIQVLMNLGAHVPWHPSEVGIADGFGTLPRSQNVVNRSRKCIGGFKREVLYINEIPKAFYRGNNVRLF